MFKNSLKTNRIFTIIGFISPLMLILCLLIFFPILKGIYTSFTVNNLVDRSGDFIGLKNYTSIIRDFYFWRVFLNTIVYTIVAILLATITALLIAFLLNKDIPFKSIFRSLIAIPWVAPPMIIAIIWVWIYSRSYSPINEVLIRLSIIKQPIDWLGDISIGIGPLTLPMLCTILIYIWFSFPFLTFMFLSGLQSIPDELYEAAVVDGANGLQQFFHITLPLLKPVITIVLTLLFIWTFQSFNINYLITGGGPRGYTNLLSIYIYNNAFKILDFGKAAALGVIMALVVLIPGLYYIRTVLKQLKY